MPFSRRFLISLVGGFVAGSRGSGADLRQMALERLEPLASALADARPQVFAAQFEDSMAELEELRGNVQSLVAQAECASSVTIVSASEEGCVADWILNIRLRTASGMKEAGRSERRREKVTVVYGEKKKLRSLTPVSFFAPLV
jgi:hypothetical protein